MFCTNCGHKLNGDEKICPNCGFSLTNEATETPTPPPTQDTSNPTQMNDPFHQTPPGKSPFDQDNTKKENIDPFNTPSNYQENSSTFQNQQSAPNNLNQQQTPPNSFNQQQMNPNGFNQQMNPNGFNQQQMNPNGFNQQMNPNGFNQQMNPNGFNQQMNPNGFNQQQMNPNGFNQQQMNPNGFNQQQVPFNNVPKKKRKSKKPLIAIIMVIVLVVVGVGGYFVWDKFFNDNDMDGVSKTLSQQYEFVLKSPNTNILVDDYNNGASFTISTSGEVEKVELFQKGTDTTYEMVDTGDSSLMDDVANDGIYTYYLTIDNSKEGDFQYYAKVTKKDDTVETNTVTISVLKAITQSEADEMAAIVDNSTLDGFIDIMTSSTDEGELEDAKDGIVEYFKGLEDDGDISDLKGGTDEGVVTFKFTNGVIGGFILEMSNEDGNFSSGTYLPVDSKVNSPVLNSEDSSSGEKLYSVEEGNVVGNNKVLILSSFSSAPSNFTKSYTDLKDKLDNFDDYNFETEIVFDATLADYRTKLSGYGMIFINSHGSMYNGNPMICLDEAATSANYVENSSDLKAGRAGAFGTAWDYDATYAIFPSFIEYYYMFDELPNSLVYMCICHGFETDGMANAFLSAGAQTVTGFSDTVLVSFDRKILTTYVDELLGGLTTEKAVDEAIDVNGSNDGDDTPAYFKRKGNPNLVVLNMGILNGSFEEDLKYWAHSGDCRIIGSLTDLYPTDEYKMSIISTGLGSVTDSTSTVSQTFIVPKNATSIKFDYDVVSEEPMEYVDSNFDDVVTIEIIDSDGNAETLVYENINDSSWNEVGGDYFSGGDSTTYDTLWANVSFDISSYRGECITLIFRTYDVGDSAYDTAGLIDNVRLYVED